MRGLHMIDEHTRILGDRIAAGAGAVSATTWGLAEASHMANDLVPILTVFVLALTAAWYLLRFVDRFRFGAVQKRGGDDGED